MRYINKQPDGYSCGPVAVMNAIKWLGGKMSFKKDRDIFTGFGCDKDGTNRLELTESLKAFNIKHKYYKTTTIKDIERCLARGSSVILLYKLYVERGSWGHCVFIDKDNDWWFKSYNFTKEGIYVAPKFLLGQWFRSSRRWSNKKFKYPVMWEIYP